MKTPRSDASSEPRGGGRKWVAGCAESQLEAELDEIGFISPGSLVVRETSCGKPGCRCQGDPPQRHGPYFQWSRTREGRTESRRLDEHEAELYREWIDNRRRLERIVAEMEQVSESAGEILLRRARSGRR